MMVLYIKVNGLITKHMVCMVCFWLKMENLDMKALGLITNPMAKVKNTGLMDASMKVITMREPNIV